MNRNIHGGDIYRHENVIDFSSNTNPYGPPESVIEAICQGAKNIEHYPDVECTLLRTSLSKKHKVSPDSIFIGNGAAEVIFALVQAIKPKKALVTGPTFSEYIQALRAVDCKIEVAYLSKENGFMPDKDLLARVTDDIDMVFLCNPNNPTGVLASKDFVDALAKKCKEKSAFLLLDECFIDFVKEPGLHSYESEAALSDHVMILKAFTKIYAMAGVRLGYGICQDPDLIKRMGSKLQPWNVSSLAQAAGLAALKEDSFVLKSMSMLRTERHRLEASLREIGFEVFNGAANYIFFRGPKELWKLCLDKGILIRDCSNYLGLSEGYFRVAVRKEEDNTKLIDILMDLKEKEEWQKF